MESIEIHGYAILEGVLAPLDIYRIQEDVASSSLLRSRAGARHVLHAPSVEALARDARLRAKPGGFLRKETPPLPSAGIGGI